MFIQMLRINSFLAYSSTYQAICFPCLYLTQLLPANQHALSPFNLSPIRTVIQCSSHRRRPLGPHTNQHSASRVPSTSAERTVHLLVPLVVDTCIPEHSSNSERSEEATAACPHFDVLFPLSVTVGDGNLHSQLQRNIGLRDSNAPTCFPNSTKYYHISIQPHASHGALQDAAFSYLNPANSKLVSMTWVRISHRLVETNS
jgi:hypothetical protein